MFYFTKFAVLKYTTGITISRMLSGKTALYPIRIVTKNVCAKTSKLPLSDWHLQNTVFWRCMSSKKEDSTNPPFTDNNESTTKRENKGPIQRRIYKRPKKYKFIDHENIKRPFMEIDIDSTGQDKFIKNEKILSPDIHNQDNITIEKEDIKGNGKTAKGEFASSAKDSNPFDLKSEENADEVGSKIPLMDTEKLNSIEDDATNDLGIPSDVKKHTAVHIEYVEKTGKEALTTDSDIHDILERSRSDYKSEDTISAVNRAISSALDKDLLTAHTSTGEGDFDKLFGKSQMKMRRNRKQRMHAKKMRRPPIINNAYENYLNDERDDETTTIKHRRLSRNPYTSVSGGTNFAQFNKLRNRRKRMKKASKSKNPVVMPSYDDTIASTDDAIKKSFHVAATKNAYYKKPSEASETEVNAEKPTPKESSQGGGDIQKPPKAGFIENSKIYVRTLFYSLLTLASTLALYLTVDWMSEQRMNLSTTPLDAINAYLTTIPTEETAFGNEPNSDLASDEVFTEKVDSEAVKDEQ